MLDRVVLKRHALFNVSNHLGKAWGERPSRLDRTQLPSSPIAISVDFHPPHVAITVICLRAIRID